MCRTSCVLGRTGNAAARCPCCASPRVAHRAGSNPYTGTAGTGGSGSRDRWSRCRRRRDGGAARVAFRERIGHLRDLTRWIRVHPQLIDTAPLLRLEPLFHAANRSEDVVLLDDGELLRVRRPFAARIFAGRRANVGALLQALVRPDVDELVQRADLRVPETVQRRVLLAELVGLGEPLFVLGTAPGLRVYVRIS